MFQQVTIYVGYVSAYGLQKVNSHEYYSTCCCERKILRVGCRSTSLMVFFQSKWRRRGSCSREQGTWELRWFGDHRQRRRHRAEKRHVGARWVGAFLLVRFPPEQIIRSMPLPSQTIRSGRGVCRSNRHAFIGVI
uniref:Uncharacterized protein n=1 Tax=Triticum urartu TaxID=4572 RepID=A0A8R7PHN9_TRIUA